MRWATTAGAASAANTLRRQPVGGTLLNARIHNAGTVARPNCSRTELLVACGAAWF